MIFPPVAWIPADAASSRRAFQAPTTTIAAPSAANRVAMASPVPETAP